MTLTPARTYPIVTPGLISSSNVTALKDIRQNVMRSSRKPTCFQPKISISFLREYALKPRKPIFGYFVNNLAIPSVVFCSCSCKHKKTREYASQNTCTRTVWLHRKRMNFDDAKTASVRETVNNKDDRQSNFLTRWRSSIKQFVKLDDYLAIRWSDVSWFVNKFQSTFKPKSFNTSYRCELITINK
jgi:hypothetical protein